MDEKLKIALVNNDFDYFRNNREHIDINHRFADEDGDTLLLYALSDSGNTIYMELLEQGADVFASNNEGETILHSIVYSAKADRLSQIEAQYPEAITKLINMSSVDGTTPLMLSVLLRKMDIFEWLLAKGADVNISDDNQNTPFHMACSEGDLFMVKSLVSHKADLHLKTRNGNYPFALAVNADHADVVRFLFPLMYRLT